MRIINLLPKIKQQELRYRGMFFSLMRFIVLAGVSFAIVIMLQLLGRFYLQYQLRHIQSGIEQLKTVSNKQENALLKARIKLINSQIGDFNTITLSTPTWSKVLRSFAELVPEQVAIQSFTADAVKKQVLISGFAPSREQVIALYNNIAADREHFSNIDYPLENVTKPTDVSFHFSFTVVDSLLKQ